MLPDGLTMINRLDIYLTQILTQKCRSLNKLKSYSMLIKAIMEHVKAYHLKLSHTAGLGEASNYRSGKAIKIWFD